MKCFLSFADDYGMDDALFYPTKRAALLKFEKVAQELARYGQKCEASIYLAPSRAALTNYPDFVCSVGPRGGIKVERA